VRENLLEAETARREEVGLSELNNAPSTKPAPKPIICLYVSTYEEIVATELVQLTNGLVEVMIRTAVLIFEIGLTGEGDV
jgi:hypothetical protein